MKIPVYSYGGTAEGPPARWRWWREEDPGPQVVQSAQKIESDQASRRDIDLTHARLYENQDLRSLYDTGIASAALSRLSQRLGYRVTFNVVQSCVDTAAAKIAKNKPRVTFMTAGGAWSVQRRAKGLTKFCDGIFHASRMYEHAQRAFIDAAVFGTGVIKIFAEDAEIKAERVLPGELLCDDTEAIYGKPRTLYQRKWVYKDVLIEMFGSDPKVRAHLERATGANPANDVRAGDMIAVYEAWHLPSGKKAKDGKHVIAIDGCTLFQETWTKTYFPFVFFRWTEKLVGLWGRGVAEQLHGIQLEINKLLERIRQAQHLVGVPRVLAEKGSVEKPKLNNETGGILEYKPGSPKPEVVVFQSVPPELYAHLETLYQKAFEVTGISLLSAAARKPEGLDAAVALREFHDIESERFVVLGQRYEQMFLDAAEIMIDLARGLYAGNKDHVVKAPGTKFLETIAWKDVDLAEDAYIIQRFPTSILPTTPAGRLQRVQELLDAEFIDKDEALRMLDMPDLDRFVSLRTSAIEDIERILERIVEKGEYETPEPAMDLRRAITMAQSAYLKGRNDGIPEARLEKLLRFMDECKVIAETVAGLPQEPDPTPVVGPDAAAAVANAEAAAMAQGAQMPGAAAAVAPPGVLPEGADLTGLEGAGTPAVPSDLAALPPEPTVE